jgi:tRNA(adenine34) deaminase
MSHDDKYFLKKAVEVGQRGKAKGISPVEFGAVIVRKGKVIAADHSHTHELYDPAAHAETTTIVQACKKVKNRHLRGCTLYASHEPCLMCLACASFAEIDRIVFATPAPKGSTTWGFRDAGIFSMAKKSMHPMKVERIKL